jgi:hypothetical protein
MKMVAAADNDRDEDGTGTAHQEQAQEMWAIGKFFSSFSHFICYQNLLGTDL